MRRCRGLLGVAALVVLLGYAVSRSPAIVTAHLRVHQIPHSTGLVFRSWSDILLAPWFWGFVILITVLERLFPARRGEGTFSVGAAQDLVWFVFFAGFQLTLVRLYYVLLGGVAGNFLQGLAVHPSALLGTAGVVAAFVATDFLNWVNHYARHRVPAFWHFHEIHHSQRSMNMFTDSRVHFVEPMIASTVVFLPSALLGLPFKQAAAITTASLFYERFFHANIRTNLGPLRYILVTPQSHRMHHSIRPEDHDTNFATIFSIWDRLFRTQHHSHRTYPLTGLMNPAVPVETSSRPLALLTTYAKQLAYPFRAVLETSRVDATSREGTVASEVPAVRPARVA